MYNHEIKTYFANEKKTRINWKIDCRNIRSRDIIIDTIKD